MCLAPVRAAEAIVVKGFCPDRNRKHWMEEGMVLAVIGPGLKFIWLPLLCVWCQQSFCKLPCSPRVLREHCRLKEETLPPIFSCLSVLEDTTDVKKCHYPHSSASRVSPFSETRALDPGGLMLQCCSSVALRMGVRPLWVTCSTWMLFFCPKYVILIQVGPLLASLHYSDHLVMKDELKCCYGCFWFIFC